MTDSPCPGCKMYIDTRIEDLRREMDAKNVASALAVATASDSLTHRLEGMNEFRKQISDERASYVTRAELDLRADAIRVQLQSLDRAVNQNVGKSSITTAIWSIGSAVVAGVIIGVIVTAVKP